MIQQLQSLLYCGFIWLTLTAFMSFMDYFLLGRHFSFLGLRRRAGLFYFICSQKMPPCFAEIWTACHVCPLQPSLSHNPLRQYLNKASHQLQRQKVNVTLHYMIVGTSNLSFFYICNVHIPSVGSQQQNLIDQ